jgi:hypothetical protein
VCTKSGATPFAVVKDASRKISIGNEANDDEISRRGDCRWLVACGFGAELCRQADVRNQECREIAVSRDKAQRFSDPPI